MHRCQSVLFELLTNASRSISSIQTNRQCIEVNLFYLNYSPMYQGQSVLFKLIANVWGQSVLFKLLTNVSMSICPIWTTRQYIEVNLFYLNYSPMYRGQSILFKLLTNVSRSICSRSNNSLYSLSPRWLSSVSTVDTWSSLEVQFSFPFVCKYQHTDKRIQIEIIILVIRNNSSSL